MGFVPSVLACGVKLHLWKIDSEFLQSLLDYNRLLSLQEGKKKKSLSAQFTQFTKWPLQTPVAILRGTKLEKKCTVLRQSEARETISNAVYVSIGCIYNNRHSL